MNDNRKKNKERQAHIARLLEKNERINVNQLFEILQVSKETIRRDLKEITECGSGRTTAMEGMDWQNPSARAQNFHNPNGFPKSFYVPQGRNLQSIMR